MRIITKNEDGYTIHDNVNTFNVIEKNGNVFITFKIGNKLQVYLDKHVGMDPALYTRMNTVNLTEDFYQKLDSIDEMDTVESELKDFYDAWKEASEVLNRDVLFRYLNTCYKQNDAINILNGNPEYLKTLTKDSLKIVTSTLQDYARGKNSFAFAYYAEFLNNLLDAELLQEIVRSDAVLGDKVMLICFSEDARYWSKYKTSVAEIIKKVKEFIRVRNANKSTCEVL